LKQRLQDPQADHRDAFAQQVARPSLACLPLFLQARGSLSAIDAMARGASFAHRFRRSVMGKYFLAWLLGVPGIVLLVVYLFFH
jgi:hypothetical protein